jgi:hypothetical protein
VVVVRCSIKAPCLMVAALFRERDATQKVGLCGALPNSG